MIHALFCHFCEHLQVFEKCRGVLDPEDEPRVWCGTCALPPGCAEGVELMLMLDVSE